MESVQDPSQYNNIIISNVSNKTRTQPRTGNIQKLRHKKNLVRRFAFIFVGRPVRTTAGIWDVEFGKGDGQ